MIRGPRSRMPSDNIQALGLTTMIPQPQYLQVMPVSSGSTKFDVTGHALAHRVKKHGGLSGSGMHGGAMKEFTFGTPSLQHEASSRPYRSYGGPRHGGVQTPGPRSRSVGAGLHA
jgi:hypothetical protein